MLLGPSQQTHSSVPLRWVLLPDGDEYSAVWRQTSGKTTGNQGSAWGFLLYQKDICLVLSFYRFSYIWLAGGSYWRNIGGCQHVAVKTKLRETTGSSTVPAGPGNSHCQFHHTGLAGSTCPEATCGALQKCLRLPRADHNASSRSHRAGQGTAKRNRWWEGVQEASRRDRKAKQGKDVGLRMVAPEEVIRLRALGSVTWR